MSLRGEPTIAAAIAKSRLRLLPAATLDKILANARTSDVPRGVVELLQGRDGIHASLVVTGLIRAFRTTEDGRQMTVRYAPAGDLSAMASVHARRPGALAQQAMMPTRILRFHPDTISELTRRDLDVANMIAEDLLDLAAAESRGGAPLVAHVSQQALADGIGCVREVVVRLLRELREEGLIRTGRDEIELLQPDRLHGETFPRDD